LAIIEKKLKRDFLRGKDGEITIRFDEDDLVKLPCHCNYDPALCSENGNSVMLVKKVEVKNKDGSWSPYPSVSWLDDDAEFWFTVAIIKKTNEKGFDIMGSSEGVPDSDLYFAAEKAGIYIESEE